MKLLLDTHVFIWWAQEPERLSQQALELCRDTDNSLILSVVSIWEMQIKHQLGKADFILKTSLREMIESQQSQNGVEVLRIEAAHVMELDNLPYYTEHRDPFDRLLIAQAKAEDIILFSVDHKMYENPYPVSLIK